MTEDMTPNETLSEAGAGSEPLDDDEVEARAIIAVMKALKSLAPDTRRRVIDSAVAKYPAAPTPPGPFRGSGDVPRTGGRSETPVLATGGDTAIDPDAFEDFASLFEAAQPANDVERTITACYWVQVRLGKNPFISQDANTLLKNLGHQVRDITVPFDALRARRPSLVIQIKKDGSHQQSRKQYRLTPPGIKFVADALRSGGFAQPETA